MAVWVRPVNAPITQVWGNGATGPNGAGGHPGTDYGAPSGTVIVSASDGAVSYAGPADGFGDNAVSIYHPADDVSTTYGHMEAHYVSAGQQVRAGDVIGLCGSQGWSTGPHLHFEVRPGDAAFGGNPPNVDSDAWLHSHSGYGARLMLQPAGPVSASDRQDIEKMQAALQVDVDGGWGQQTDDALQTIRWHHLAPPNTPIPNTQVALLQAIWRFSPEDQDGIWGTATDKIYLMLRYCYLNK